MIYTNTKLQESLSASVAEALWQAVNILAEIDDSIYTGGGALARSNGGTIGGHFRHCLEFVNCFLNGIEIGKINYNSRERDREVETNRKYAVNEFVRAINRLENFSVIESGKLLLVKPEDIAEADGDDFWCASSVERELEFMQSHTIHHYALIAFKLRQMNFRVPPEFGVAPSTLRFWKQEKTN